MTNDPVFRRLSDEDWRDFNDPLRFFRGLAVGIGVSLLLWAAIAMLWCAA